MPNQPQATTARSMAATFAPRTPKLARQRTGNEMPYFVPACALSTIGTSTIQLPSRIVAIACHQFIPCEIRPLASVYVVMTTLMPIQSAAMLYVDQVRRAIGVGARSWFHSGLADKSSVVVTKSVADEYAGAALAASIVIRRPLAPARQSMAD